MIKRISDFLRYIKEFRHKSLFFKNLVIINILALIPISVSIMFFYSATTKNITNEISRANANYFQSVITMFDNTIKASEDFAVQTCINDKVISLALSQVTDENIYKLQQEVKDYIKNFVYINDYIHSIYIYTERNHMIIENQVILNVDDHVDNGWYKYYEETECGRSIAVGRKYNGRYPEIISVIRPIGDDGKLGCVVVNSDISKVINLSGNSTKNVENMFLLQDEKGDIFYSELKKENTVNLKSYNKNLIKINDKEYFFTKQHSGKYKWDFIMLSSNSYYKEFAAEQLGYALLIIWLLIIMVIITSLITAVLSYKPIRNLMLKIDANDIVGSKKSNNGQENEISYILRKFNSKKERTEELESELKFRMLLLNNAQTHVLQAQINPHFLNNAMDVINWMSIDLLGENNSIAEIIRPLSALLSICSDTENYIIKIKEEMHHANIYTYMANIVYENNINFVWRINPEITEYKIIKFTLQPIIENSIIHGIRRKRKSGTILIEGDFCDEGIKFNIRDDGVGISAEMLKKLETEFHDENIYRKNHLGLNNVNQRIKLVFGSQYGLKVGNNDTVGANIEIVIPKIN